MASESDQPPLPCLRCGLQGDKVPVGLLRDVAAELAGRPDRADWKASPGMVQGGPIPQCCWGAE